MKEDIYKINNLIEKIKLGKSTLFLDQRELKLVQNKLPKKDYKIYHPYVDSEKVMLYTGKLPNITLFKINTMDKIRHQDILGSLFALGITASNFGDIIIDNGDYYFYAISNLKEFLKSNLTEIAKSKVKLEEIDIKYLENYTKKYEELTMITSSLRLDSIVSNIINSSRKVAVNKLENKDIIVNYSVVTKSSYILKENDVFSIKKIGKFKFVGIINSTKKDNYIVKYLKYV